MDQAAVDAAIKVAVTAAVTTLTKDFETKCDFISDSAADKLRDLRKQLDKTQNKAAAAKVDLIAPQLDIFKLRTSQGLPGHPSQPHGGAAGIHRGQHHQHLHHQQHPLQLRLGERHLDLHVHRRRRRQWTSRTATTW